MVVRPVVTDVVAAPQVTERGLEPFFLWDGVPINVLISLEIPLKLVIFSGVILLHLEGFLEHVTIVLVNIVQELHA